MIRKNDSRLKELLKRMVFRQNGKLILDSIPCNDQFLDVVRRLKDGNRGRRQGRRGFNARGLAKKGRSGSEGTGPCYKAQTDGPVADIYLVSRRFPRLVVGRPGISFSIDRLSRMIVGFHAGFEPAPLEDDGDGAAGQDGRKEP
jgi:hypothetical protein